jgi:type II secretory pathway pseudopilin PulG
MKKVMKSVLGVTLLEVMLVLAVAAMIIVMSVRYYQSATANQQANSALQITQGITAAADGLAQATGSYVTGGVATATVAGLMPGGGVTITAPWGGLVTLGGVTASTYVVTFGSTPVQVCSILKSRLVGNPKYTLVSANACTAVANFTYTYNSTY